MLRWLAGVALEIVGTFIAGAGNGLVLWTAWNASAASHFDYAMPLAEAIAWPVLVMTVISTVTRSIRRPYESPWERIADDIIQRIKRRRDLPEINDHI